jgi:hypothetical protein
MGMVLKAEGYQPSGSLSSGHVSHYGRKTEESQLIRTYCLAEQTIESLRRDIQSHWHELQDCMHDFVAGVARRAHMIVGMQIKLVGVDQFVHTLGLPRKAE